MTIPTMRVVLLSQNREITINVEDFDETLHATPSEAGLVVPSTPAGVPFVAGEGGKPELLASPSDVAAEIGKAAKAAADQTIADDICALAVDQALELVAKASDVVELAEIEAGEKKGPGGGRKRVLKAITARFGALEA